MLKIKNLVKEYKGKKVLNHLEVELSSTGIDIIVGMNGSGKTTLLHNICGVTSFQAGEITIDGVPFQKKQAKEKLFYIPSDFFLPEYLSGEEYADFVFGRYPTADKELFLQLLEIYDFQPHLSKLLGEYSLGMRQKIQLLIGIATNSKYIFADELFNGLDFESYLLTEQLINVFSKNRKFIIVSHNIEFIQKTNARIFLLRQGILREVRDLHEAEEIVINEGHFNEKFDYIQRLATDYSLFDERSVSSAVFK